MGYVDYIDFETRFSRLLAEDSSDSGLHSQPPVPQQTLRGALQSDLWRRDSLQPRCQAALAQVLRDLSLIEVLELDPWPCEPGGTTSTLCEHDLSTLRFE